MSSSDSEGKKPSGVPLGSKPPAASPPSPQPLRRTRRSKRSLWVPVVVLGLVLAVGFELVNAINDQAATSPTLLLSMLGTTIPLLIVIVAGLAFIMRGRPR